MEILQLDGNLKDLEATGCCPDPQTWRDGMTAAIALKARSHFLLCKKKIQALI